MKRTPWQRSPTEVAHALQHWQQQLPHDWPPADALTQTFCRTRLTTLGQAPLLQAKLHADVGHGDWRPLGRVLALVSENDHLGMVAAVVAAALTGNQITIKTQQPLGILEALRKALDWTPDDCRLLRWHSPTQDDAQVLAGIDAVLMAGSEALIRHYRRVADASVRLIEYGPRLSAAWVQSWPAQAGAQADCVRALLHDTAVFAQNVCSSPQLVLVPDQATGLAVWEALAAELSTLAPLPEALRLAQLGACQTLRLAARLNPDIRLACDTNTGWAVSLTPWDSVWTLTRGLRLVVGDLAALDRHCPGLQTLGVWPDAAYARWHSRAFHCCALGRMHQRTLLAPHDGQRELVQWVQLLSCEPAPAHHSPETFDTPYTL
jgi:hypothetical protein